MAIKFRFFAQSAQWVGSKSLELEIKDSVKLADLIDSKPELAQVAKHKELVRVSVNCEFSDFEREVSNGDEIAILPPVSGG